MKMFAKPVRRLGVAALIVAVGLGLGAAAASAEPAIWVAEQGGAKVYLFGTVHLLKKDTPWETPKIQKAFAEGQELWLEIKDLDDPAAMRPLVVKYGVDADHPLSTKMSEADKALLAKDAAALGAPVAAFEPLRPWMAALQLTLAPVLKAGYGAGDGVDINLKAEAVKRGEPVEAFETTEEQLRFFANLPEATEVEYLHTALKDFDTVVPDLEEVAKAWEVGDVATIDRAMVQKMRSESPEIYEVLLKRRNAKIADQIKARMAKGGVIFVAIGAGHLAGDDSVQADLERLGVHVRRL